MTSITRIIIGNLLFIIGVLFLLWAIKRLIERRHRKK